MVTDTSTSHTHLMEEHRAAAHNNYSEMNYKLESQTVSCTEWDSKIKAQLHSIHEKVDKFVAEDLRRDVPTGTYYSLTLDIDTTIYCYLFASFFRYHSCQT